MFQTFQAWTLKPFPRISAWVSVPTYTEDMSSVTAFAPLRGNQETKSFRVYLNRLVSEDTHFNKNVDHRETQPFDEIFLYSGWLTYRSRLTAPHLPECVMWQFDYSQIILRHPILSTPPALTCRQMDAMCDDYDSHLVLETWSTIVVRDWSHVDSYIRWFYRDLRFNTFQRCIS